MFLTTTDNIQGKNVTEYLGIVASVILTVMPGGNKMMGYRQFHETGAGGFGKKSGQAWGGCRYRIEVYHAGQQLHAAWNGCEVKLMGVSL